MKFALIAAMALLLGACLLVRADDPATKPAEGKKIVTPSGLTIMTTVEGEGAAKGDTVWVHYIGTFTDGKKFTSSYDTNEPYAVTIGETNVIKGWHEGLVGIKFGEKRRLTVPPELAYGAAGKGPIPPNTTLVFDLECLGVKRGGM